MAIKNFTGGNYNRTYEDKISGSKHQVFVCVPYIHKAGDYGSSDSYRAGIRLDTRGYDYMYFSVGNVKWRFFTIETNTALADVRSTLAAASISRGSLVSLRATTGTLTGKYQPRECKYWGSKSTEEGGTQIVLERTMGRFPDPEFRSDWSWWTVSYSTSNASKLTQANGTAFGTDIVLNRTASGNLYTTDVGGHSCLTNSTAAHNWTLGQVNAFGRARKGGDFIRVDCSIPYRQIWNMGGDGDEAGITGADDTHGMYHWENTDRANRYPFDDYLHNSTEVRLNDYSDGLSSTYTGTSANNIRGMFDDDWGARGGKFYPIALATTNDGRGAYNTGAGTLLGYMEDLPDGLWIHGSPAATSATRKTATTGWTNNGGYTSADTLALPAEDTNADSDTTDTGEAATTVVTGHDHMVEFDLWVTLHKRS